MKWICTKCEEKYGEKPCLLETDTDLLEPPTNCPWAISLDTDEDLAEWKIRPIQVGDVTEHGRVKWIDPMGGSMARICYTGFKDDSPTVTEGFDPVSKPAHYTEGRKFEPIDCITDWNLDFCLGNAVKYISRAGRKDDEIQDLEKALFYLQYKINQLKKVE